MRLRGLFINFWSVYPCALVTARVLNTVWQNEIQLQYWLSSACSTQPLGKAEQGATAIWMLGTLLFSNLTLAVSWKTHLASPEPIEWTHI